MPRDEPLAPGTAVIMVAGELVALGPIRRDLAPVYVRWFNDLGTMRTLGQPPLPKTLEDEQRWFDQSLASGQPVRFTIYEQPSLRPIGTTDLRDIDYRSGTAEFGIVIGEPDARGRGCGTEATRLVLDYAFSALGLTSVMLKVVDFNPAAKRAYEKAGFRDIGRRRRAHIMGGRLWDVWYMDCLAEEFTPGAISTILLPDQPGMGEGTPRPAGRK
jgi:diamine N-acetyltransferase